MALIQLNNQGEPQQIDGVGAGLTDGTKPRVNGTGDVRKVSRVMPTTALHEGGIVLSGTRTVDLQAAERFRILRAKIERMNLTNPERRLLAVTSAVPEEGKSLIAANLARALAMDPRGKTLLIDCD